MTAARGLSTVFGLLMVAAVLVQTSGPAFVAAAAAALAVVAGTLFRPAATLAVLLVVLAIVLADPSPVFAALSGLSATAYLVLRYSLGPPAGIVTVTTPTMLAAVGFTFLGLIATAFPLRLPWLPLAAPLAVLGIYVLATGPFLRDRD